VGRVRERALELLRQAAEERGWRVLEAQVEPARVVVRVEADARISPHLLAVRLKADTSPVLREEFPRLLRLPSLWTREHEVVTVTPE